MTSEELDESRRRVDEWRPVVEVVEGN